MVSDANDGYSSVANFTDPTTALSSKFNGGGLRIGAIGSDQLNPIVVARNIGTITTTISGQIPYTDASGNVQFVTVPATQIDAGKSKSINLKPAIQAANVPPSVTFAGINLEYSTAPGTVLMNALSVSQSGQQVFQVPLLDPDRLPSSAGGFPWKVDGNYTTVIFIKNESNQPKKYNANLTYNGGSYSLGVREVKPWQTVMIDFKQLRDSQTPDSIGQVIPINIGTGQLSWSMFGADNKHMSGRSEQVNTVTGIASTYACYNCCPDNYHSTGQTFPAYFETAPGGGTRYLIGAESVNCYGGRTGTLAFYGYGWFSSNTGIGTIDNDGESLAIAPGVVDFTGSFSTIRYDWDGRDCMETNFSEFVQGEMEVRPPSVIFDEIGSIEKGGTKNITARISNGKNTQITFFINDVNNAAGGATFSDGSLNKTYTATTNSEVIVNYTIKGVSGSIDLNNYRIRATYNNGNLLATKNFTVSSVRFEKVADCAGFDDVTGYLFIPKTGNNTVKAKITPNGATGTFNLQLQNGITVSATSVSSEQTLTITSSGNAGAFTLQALANQATSPAQTLNVLVRNRIDKTVVIKGITEDNDDVQALPVGAKGQSNSACVTFGNNGFRDSIPNGDDQVTTNSINNGTNKICDTTANATDIPPSSPNIPTASALQSALNNTYWGKQANIYFTVTRGQDEPVNFDFDRDGEFSGSNAVRADEYQAIETVREDNYEINLYYTGLTFAPILNANAEAIPQAGSVFFSPSHNGLLTYVASHEIGHILMPNATGSNLHSLYSSDLMYFLDLPTSPCQIRKRDWDSLISQ